MNKIPTQEHIDTCVESRDKLKPKKHEYRKKIYTFIEVTGGATCDEVEVGLNLRHQTASCFIRFLTQDDYLYATSERRTTRAGRKAIVWKTRIPNEQQMKFI
jgi:predicted transcriptional regulator